MLNADSGWEAKQTRISVRLLRFTLIERVTVTAGWALRFPRAVGFFLILLVE